MTYRDDTSALAARLDALERDLAHAEGTRRGLGAVLAELDADARERERRTKANRPSLVARILGGSLGIVGGLVCGFLASGAGCFLLTFLASCGGRIDLEMRGSLADSTDAVLRPGEGCTTTVAGERDEAGACSARVTCGDAVLYDGKGTCATYFDDERVEFWDHSADDGTPACFISEPHRLAAIRTRTSSTEIATLSRGL